MKELNAFLSQTKMYTSVSQSGSHRQIERFPRAILYRCWYVLWTFGRVAAAMWIDLAFLFPRFAHWWCAMSVQYLCAGLQPAWDTKWAKGFLRVTQIFYTMSNRFELCPKHFSRGWCPPLVTGLLMWISFFPICANEDQVSCQIGRYIRHKNSTISYEAELFRIVAVQKTNTLLSIRRASCWIVYALWLLLLCIILSRVRNLNNGNLCEKAFMFT